MRSSEVRLDYVLVGGGLQNALVLLGLLERRPGVRVALVEREHRLGGNHTWCFHAADVPAGMAAVARALVEHSWPGYRVRFPGGERRLDAAYRGFSAERLRAVLAERCAGAPGVRVLTGREAAEVGEHRVRLEDGETLEARVVVDARGPDVAGTRGASGYQKFVGVELELDRDHGLELPLVMDATVAQRDGYRFLYVLPLGARRVLVEDTSFSDSPQLDVAGLRAGALAYAEANGLGGGRVVRDEQGVLPMPFRGQGPRPWRSGPLQAGYRGGWLHAATGYSFPIALRLAELVSRLEPEELFGTELARLAADVRFQSRFAYRLNHLLFHWFLPEGRTGVFERFYRLPEATIERFYALRTTRGDRFRILVGRPPRGLSLRARLSVQERLHEPVGL